MKKSVFLAFFAVWVTMAACSGGAARQSDALWDDANEAYRAGDYGAATALYDSLEHSGMVSAKLYFNKGNALFKMGKTGPAILYYAKAQRLNPGDGDIRHNLAIASSHTRNRIEPVPQLFLKRWVRALGTLLDGNDWAVCVLVFWGLTLTGGLAFLLPFSTRIRRMGFYGGVGTLAMLALSFGFAQSAYNESVDPTEGVVMSAQAAVKSSPDSSGTDLFVLYEGDRLSVLDALGEWSEIAVANGNRGWVRNAAFELVD